jgi:hypothetical protein
MISSERFETGARAAITDGKTKVTFEYPSDFVDWLNRVPDLDLRKWQWVQP